MHVLRASLHTPPFVEGSYFPTTVIVRDVDVTVTPDEWQRQMEGADGPPVFVTTDVFEAPDGELESAIRAATERLNAANGELIETERQMAVGFYWFAMQLAKVKPTGTLQQKDPAPFGVRDARTILRQLAHHPSYEGQTVIIIADDGQHVRLQRLDDSHVSIEEIGAYR